jgi:multiple sugar transport system permease protein
MAALTRQPKFTSRRTRILRENMTAYAFILPAMVLIFLFGIFPVAFAFFVSLHRWRRLPEAYQGLSNYVRALDNFAYVLFFWLALGALAVALLQLRQLWLSRERGRAFTYLIPGLGSAATALLFINWAAILLPIILDIPNRIRGQERVQGLFVSELLASFQIPEAAAAGSLFLFGFIIVTALSLLWVFAIKGEAPGRYLLLAGSAAFFAAAGGFTLQLTLDQVQIAAAAARESGETLPIWSQVIFISLGVLALGSAYWLWRRAIKQTGERDFALQALAALLLLGGGYLLMAELPRALVSADPDVLRGLSVTVMFALGTVPFQLGFGLLLAYFLFQKIKGKSFFRVVYFLPYIMPFVATSVVFNILFSHRPTSPANHVLNVLGLPIQKWLLEPTGIFQLIFGSQVPDILAGPGLALVVIMIYTTWTYIGYDAAVFLAGLGNIPNELYEAARIDGASEWALFRHITLPLLSPTTFFLTLIAITGTFRAFTQIWIMRNPANQSAVDTLGVNIFETVRGADPNMGYGSAMSFVLFGVILLLTLFQNRMMRSSTDNG